MKTPASLLVWVSLLAGLLAPSAFAAAAASGRSDILPGNRRLAAIETGQRLARPGELPVVAADIASPFTPPDFDQPTEAPAPRPGAAGPATPGPAAPATQRLSGAREILETLTPLIPATGSIDFRGEWLLTTQGGRRFRVGDILNVSREGDTTRYPLEITRISATDFTLRYQGEIQTRPIVIKSSSK